MRHVVLLITLFPAVLWAERPPNVVVILADDLGYGDVQALNPQGKIATPHLDRLATQGMMFTDAHSNSAVCTPTRYGLLTGRYAWRSRLQSGVLGGLSPRLIEPQRATIASLLQDRGYHTACVGKWHLGMDFVRKEDKQVSELTIESREQVFNVDYTRPISNGPTSVGFKQFFGISASLDMVPYAFIENDRLTVEPTEDRDFAMRSDRPQARTRKGPAAPGFEAAEVLPTCTRKAVAFLSERAKTPEKPFFLYLPLTAPHTPILPTQEWTGRSKLGPYADFVMQTDAAVGEIMTALDDLKLSDNTLVIFTSDNGCSPQADFPDLLKNGHNPSHIFRGHKADLFEGGHRVPFLVRYPGVARPGSTSDQMVCMTDLLRTTTEIVGVKVPDHAAEDSVSFLPALRGEQATERRQTMILHSINGSFAIRDGSWKLCLCPDSGGWSAPRPKKDSTANLPRVQLYDLARDPGEKMNRAEQEPDRVRQMTALLEQQVGQGRSTPGPRATNTVEVRLRK